MTAPSPGYRRLAAGTVVATFLLIVWGGVVRVSDSGLGCGPAHSGTHGWPLCNGDLVPGVNLHHVIEFAHRVAAAAVVILLASLAVLAWRRYRAHRGIVLAATLGSGLVVAQALLGAATVDNNLDEGLVAAHLGLAMLLFGVTLYIWRAARPGVAGAVPVDGGPGFRVLAVASQAVLFAAIVAGGYMAGTEHFGRLGEKLGPGAHEACGRSFPGCAGGGPFPFGTKLVNIHLAHRAAVYVTVVLVLGLVALMLGRRVMRRRAMVLVLLLVGQVLLGALNVWLGEYEALIAAHLTVATLLWAALTGVTLQLFRVPAATVEPAPRPARAGEAVAT